MWLLRDQVVLEMTPQNTPKSHQKVTNLLPCGPQVILDSKNWMRARWSGLRLVLRAPAGANQQIDAIPLAAYVKNYTFRMLCFMRLF